MTARRVSSALALALGLVMILIAPSAASAQNDNFYPGPFGNDASAAEDVSDAETDTDAAADEVLSAGAVASADGTDEYGTTSSGTNLSFVVPNPQPGSGPAAGAGGTGGGLAATGSTVEPVIAVSIGFLAVGAAAVVSSRRRVRDLFN